MYICVLGTPPLIVFTGDYSDIQHKLIMLLYTYLSELKQYTTSISNGGNRADQIPDHLSN
jgi:hypothetical protein